MKEAKANGGAAPAQEGGAAPAGEQNKEASAAESKHQDGKSTGTAEGDAKKMEDLTSTLKALKEAKGNGQGNG